MKYSVDTYVKNDFVYWRIKHFGNLNSTNRMFYDFLPKACTCSFPRIPTFPGIKKALIT